jgi:adenylyltransferase/sulfurtransferase
MGKEQKKLNPISSVSQLSIRLTGAPVPGALDRHAGIAGFDQARYSTSNIVCIGAGGLIGNVAPTLVRKGIGELTIVDHDLVETSNLNRQFFTSSDVGQNKAIALARNLAKIATHSTRICGLATPVESAIDNRIDLSCDVAICGVDNNRARLAAARHFCNAGIPIIFMAVSADADHGYVFIQEPDGPCLGCLFPDALDDESSPCPGTPAIAEILQCVGAFGSYAIDTLICDRSRDWIYREVWLHTAAFDGLRRIEVRSDCPIHNG